ncbi:hypothetical protein [Streptomyces yaizuensis]|uniref:Uncharacterized protein n=1 Tax=Streptomyces yaizuensis TaxID=2989713 RepID=A0ABQ5P3S4_9ACTN|nr:hypothetical protein [Streptomyces sp. YSPA8]GLF97256.1 hypothetical protein SYYSPA8_23185 [Streptomyces sp. YSPA8]
MNDALTIGALAYDTITRRVGVVMAEYGTRYYLRPPHGGCEWDAPRTDIRPATVTDRIRPVLTEANARSSTGGIL